MSKPFRIVDRWSVEKPAQFVGRHIPPVPHPECHCGYCGNFAHERYHKIVQEVRLENGMKGAKLLAIIISLN